MIKVHVSGEHEPSDALTFRKASDAIKVVHAVEEVGKMSLEDKLLTYDPYIADIAKNPKLSNHQKKLAVLPHLKKLKEKQSSLLKQIATNSEKLEYSKSLIAAHEKYIEWLKLPPALEKNDCSRLHKVAEFMRLQSRIIPEAQRGDDPNMFAWDNIEPFVVQHDWAAAFKNATDFDGDFELPFEWCAFEFRISGISVTMLCKKPQGEALVYTPYLCFDDLWITPNEDQWNSPPLLFAKDQIKAICVALDAEVATKDTIRASSGLNAMREKKGRLPLYSYHIVSLAHRYRTSAPSEKMMEQGKKRLHFRRGHWRHFQTSKTWIRWTLVGNPELGWVDKEYRI